MNAEFAKSAENPGEISYSAIFASSAFLFGPIQDERKVRKGRKVSK
jgi:hypothetical protein